MPECGAVCACEAGAADGEGEGRPWGLCLPWSCRGRRPWAHPLPVPLPLQLLSKYDPQKEAELRSWIEGLTGLSIGPDFQKGLKDGVILCT